MKNIVMSVVLIMLLFWTGVAHTMTVYFKDGTQLEVDQVTRIGSSVCLMVDISRIDTTRTPIEALPGTTPTKPGTLSIVNTNFTPSEDNSEIIATGDVVNNTASAVQNIRITVTLQDKNDRTLLTIHGYTRPEKLEPGQTGTYRIQVRKPEGFWKASVAVKAETIPQP
ncbi:hypothetical protein U27_01623 [Candidatus Vecturithrix granuli]|uniref:Uncharacterized protein n=1 Tax=Vecturithrix granuli TaxID=1499967 RepID=A0A0S6W9C8_VECG1|nr:hypothetical protein U27_01623 [Candidatus Vecturithrix granuli]